MMAQVGRLFGLGVGPGDPELITVKALRLLRAAPVVAYHAAKGKKSNALSIVEAHLRADQIAVPLVYPVTTEKLPPHLCYEKIISDFYDEAGAMLAAHLDAGRDVAVVCEGDPFFYGSFMYLHDRLAPRYATEVVPGVCSVVAGAAVLGAPLAYRNQTLTVLSGVLEPAGITASAYGGSVWSGTAQALAWRGAPLGDLRWRLAPLDILGGRLAGHATLTRPDGSLDTRFATSFAALGASSTW